MKSCFKMCYRRKTLLAAVIFTALCYKVTAVKQLDMAPEAVDALYDGCNKHALEMVIHSGLLKQELNRSEGFQKAWYTKCSHQFNGGEKEHTAALLTYVNKKFRKDFDDAVETKGGNVSTYENSFHFKSLHFLLMDTMKLLNKKKECKQVYFVSDKKYEAKKDSTVRFGRFNSVETTVPADEVLDGGTFFNITTCFFVNLKGFCELDGDEALISPAEEFTVTNVVQINDDDNQYTEIYLKHSKLTSLHNCYIFSRSPADVSTQWIVSVLVGFSLFFFNC